MTTYLDSMVGTKFGYLTIKGFYGKNLNYSDGCVCICDCGNEVVRSLYRIQVGHTKTCGCGISKFSLYRQYPEEYSVFMSMYKRGKYYNKTSHVSYFDKGISVCNSWSLNYYEGFSNFIKDMGCRPSKEHEIDRIDNSKGYSPDNCRWVHRQVNAMNKDNTTYVELMSRKIPLRFILNLFGLKNSTIRDRYNSGLPFHLVFRKGSLKSDPLYEEYKKVHGTKVLPKTGLPKLLIDSDENKTFAKTHSLEILEEFLKFENK